jgi:hypothetical protein
VQRQGLPAPARASRLAGPVEEPCSAVRPAAADQPGEPPGERPGWRLPRSDRRPLRPPGRPAYRAGFQTTGAAGPEYRSAALPERLDLPAQSTRSSHRVRLAAAASWAPRVAAGQAQQLGWPQARRPSCQTRGATTRIAWLLEIAADPIPVRHQGRAVQGESLDSAELEYAAALGQKRSQSGRRPAAPGAAAVGQKRSQPGRRPAAPGAAAVGPKRSQPGRRAAVAVGADPAARAPASA